MIINERIVWKEDNICDVFKKKWNQIEPLVEMV